VAAVKLGDEPPPAIRSAEAPPERAEPAADEKEIPADLPAPVLAPA
jgi:hypothetical protein